MKFKRAEIKRGFLAFMRKRTLHQRIWFSFIAVITLAISVTGYISYSIAAKVVQANAFSSSQDAVNKAEQVVADKLKNIGTNIRALMFSDAFVQMMKHVQNNDSSKYYNDLSALLPVFSQVKFNDDLIQSILIVTPIGEFYPTNDYRIQPGAFYKTDMYQEIRKTGRGFWVKGHSDTLFTGGQRVLSLVLKGVIDTDPFQTLEVYVVVNVKEKELIQVLNANLSQAGYSFALLDKSGQPVMASSDSHQGGVPVGADVIQGMTDPDSGSFFHTYNVQEYLVNYKQLEGVDDWFLFGLQSKEELLREMSGIQRLTLLAIACFIGISLLISNWLTRFLLTPLQRLQNVMKRVEDNNLTVRYHSLQQDEVSQMGFRFNHMLDEINRLIQDVTEGEMEKRKAEMKALSAQIAPHFLYNTLNTIHCKAVLGENEDVSEMILALSELFMVGLSGGRELIPLADELNHAKQYMKLQQKSYEDLFEAEIDVEEGTALERMVPKIILQPLVENSILHGFKDMKAGGRIRITVTEDDRFIHITVTDNGSGLPGEKGDSRHPGRNKGFALMNISRRLQLYFGDKATLLLSRQQGPGTRADIRIPIQTKDA
ncbi:histidine kinase [Paenibacillus filicis]|uniref:Histidine kinase n=1 Tax=Paenibacillus filicis TaxID=669464 RepID=A0ABU9DUB4_9BACL